MNTIPRISEAEWEVMKILWEKHPLPANEIVDKLAGLSAWKPKTIKTMITRLVKKEAIAFHQEGRSYLYYPTVTEDECVKVASESFLTRVFSGSLNLMFANFLEEKKLSVEEIEELKNILEKKKK